MIHCRFFLFKLQRFSLRIKFLVQYNFITNCSVCWFKGGSLEEFYRRLNILSLLSHHVFIQQKKNLQFLSSSKRAVLSRCANPPPYSSASSLIVTQSHKKNNHQKSCSTHKNKHIGPSRRSTEIHPSAHMPRRVTHPPRLNFFMSPLWLKDGPNSRPFILSLHPSFSLPLCLVLSHLRHCPTAPHMGSMCAATWKRKLEQNPSRGGGKWHTHTFTLSHTHTELRLSIWAPQGCCHHGCNRG